VTQVPQNSDLHDLTLGEASRRLRNRSLSATALTSEALERIGRLNPYLHAFSLVAGEHALAQAENVDREIEAGIDRGPMHGIPIALKDIFDVGGLPTSCYSRLRDGYIAPRDSTVVQRLRQGGAVLLGKLATHEFGLGGPSFDLPLPPARNPWNLRYFCGGSSSGSGVAVAAGFVRAALGTDTSGSIRGPAFHCGTIGLKPSYGLVSRRGVFPLSFSLDHCGVLAWTVEDAAIVLQVIAGNDPMDIASECVPIPDYRAALGMGISGLRIGYPRHFWHEDEAVSPEVAQMLDETAAMMARLGAKVDEVRLPPGELFAACGRVIMSAEAYAIHESMLRERGSEYGRYTYQRLVPGVGLTATDLMRAQNLRLLLAKEVNSGVLSTHDALICAVAPSPAGLVSDFPPDWSPRATIQTIAFNVTGNPSMAVPAGFTTSGLPLGFQIVGRAFDESTVLRIGAAYQAAMGYPDRRPALDDESLGSELPTRKC
jgi:aspartyl-tRNA(Asn)/glutamyl-tRNA(Gln) amidotransferase subunit A